MEKISDNESWSQDKGEEAIEEVNALSTKMDDLLHWLDQRAKYKEDERAIEAISKSKSSPTVRKVPHQPNWRQHQDSQGMNSGNFTKQPSLREIIMQQSKINLDINTRLANNDKTLEDINVKMDSFSSGINDQLEYNKRIEAKIAQLAAALPVATNPK